MSSSLECGVNEDELAADKNKRGEFRHTSSMRQVEEVRQLRERGMRSKWLPIC